MYSAGTQLDVATQSWRWAGNRLHAGWCRQSHGMTEPLMFTRLHSQPTTPSRPLPATSHHLLAYPLPPPDISTTPSVNQSVVHPPGPPVCLLHRNEIIDKPSISTPPTNHSNGRRSHRRKTQEGSCHGPFRFNGNWRW